MLGKTGDWEQGGELFCWERLETGNRVVSFTVGRDST
jgi:hypothetical protein